MTETAQRRRLAQIVTGLETSDGAGVSLTRIIGQPQLPMLDPFLLLDAFRSDDPDDYIAGFPPHPHRGFETVTYLLAGRMRHRDSTGREGVIESGGVQWMTAGRGIVHSEMPEQENGLLEGFQLWINLPAAHKMDPPRYQERPALALPVEQRESGVRVRVLAGRTSGGAEGVIEQPLTDPLYLDIVVEAGKRYRESIPPAHNAFVYVIDGQVSVIAGTGDGDALGKGQLGVLRQGDEVELLADSDSHLLLVAGRPLNEPVARGGPFVMNTEEEVRQAFRDYREGRIG